MLIRRGMPISRTLTLSPILAIASLTACSEEIKVAPPSFGPQDVFWEALSSHCGKAYAGKLVSEDPADADFASADMRMHVSECSDTRIAIPFHVELGGKWDRSRTWLITRNDAGGLRLKHDHRHEDGSSDAVTMYGGDTAEAGVENIQNFPVDAESISLFEREDLPASVTNVWSVEVTSADTDGGTFAYQLRRTVDGGAPEDRFFRVEFDLSEEVEAPPPAWGWE